MRGKRADKAPGTTGASRPRHTDAGDLPALGVAAEESALRMHAAAIAACPGLIYRAGATVEVIEEVKRLRHAGLPAWFTIDAGPHVKVLKVLTTPEREDRFTGLEHDSPEHASRRSPREPTLAHRASRGIPRPRTLYLSPARR